MDLEMMPASEKSSRWAGCDVGRLWLSGLLRFRCEATALA